MRGEYYLLRSQLKGYIFESIILQLLDRNGFRRINHSDNKTREIRVGFIEMKGRGCWHQIDCPCDYSRVMPFIYPIRLIGEVKFYASQINKEHIREFIGIIKDIQENYFVSEELNAEMIALRRMEIGAYFSANGFNGEAEKLAYAHGIKTISYQNNYLIDRIKDLIIELEANYLSVRCISKNNLDNFKRSFNDLLINGNQIRGDILSIYAVDGYLRMLEQIRQMLFSIEGSFIGTTSTGVFLHFVGENTFPCDLFHDTDEGQCEIYYTNDNYGKRYFYLTLSEDRNRNKFYFTPPLALDEAAMFGKEIILDEKDRIFKNVYVNINLNNINRNLILHINNDWLDEARQHLKDTA